MSTINSELKTIHNKLNEENDEVYKNNLQQFVYDVTDNKVRNCNSAIVLDSSKKKFDMLIEDIKNAKYYVYMEYYIFRNDEVGREIIDVLIERCKAGVEVKIIIDSIGSYTTSKALFVPLIDCGGEVMRFGKLISKNINKRNHRKICLIDDIAYIGGCNIGEEYIKSYKMGVWRDNHIRMKGDIVRDLLLLFVADWNDCNTKKSDINIIKYNDTVKCEQSGQIKIQLVDSQWKKPYSNVYLCYIKMIQSAKKRIWITTPYITIDSTMISMLIVSVKSGIDVRVCIPSISDHPFTYSSNVSNIEKLVAGGVRCYMYAKSQYRPKGFIHSKVVIIDDDVSMVGSSNFDNRSMKTNYEVNAIVYDRDVNKVLQLEYMRDLVFSSIVGHTDLMNGTIVDKFKKFIGRLLSPMM